MKKTTNEFGNDFGFYLMLTLFIILFWGDPDIADAIVYFLMK
jgi:hypothetical protein